MIEFTKIFQGNKTTVNANNLCYPKTKTPVIEFWKVVLPPHSHGVWHEHLVPEFFYVESGELYVTNKHLNEKLDVTVFKNDDVGLTDLEMPQFIWNSTDTTTIVLAIYLGAKGIKPTRMVQCDQDINEKLLKELLQQSPTINNTEYYNDKNS